MNWSLNGRGKLDSLEGSFPPLDETPYMGESLEGSFPPLDETPYMGESLEGSFPPLDETPYMGVYGVCSIIDVIMYLYTVIHSHREVSFSSLLPHPLPIGE